MLHQELYSQPCSQLPSRPRIYRQCQTTTSSSPSPRRRSSCMDHETVCATRHYYGYICPLCSQSPNGRDHRAALMQSGWRPLTHQLLSHRSRLAFAYVRSHARRLASGKYDRHVRVLESLSTCGHRNSSIHYPSSYGSWCPHDHDEWMSQHHSTRPCRSRVESHGKSERRRWGHLYFLLGSDQECGLFRSRGRAGLCSYGDCASHLGHVSGTFRDLAQIFRGS